MTLANLLAAGKSFLSGQGQIAYRESRRAFVPQFNTGKNPFTPRVAKASAPAQVAGVERAARAARVPKWAGKLNPFRTLEPVRTFSRAEQPELSLQMVKPIRNDLSESDIERVPAKSRTLAPAPVKSTAGAWEPVNAS
jgi:hypothetical protein